MKSLLFLAMLAAAACAAAQPLRVPGKPAVAAKTVLREALRGGDSPSIAIALSRFDRARSRVGLNDSDEKAYRVGWQREVARQLAPAWTPAADGRGWVARIAVTSPDAAALRVAISVRGVPADARLRVKGTGEVQGVTLEAVAAAMRQASVYWTPLTEGDTQLLELSVDAAAAPGSARIDVTALSHLDAAPSSGFKSGGIGASQACHEDVVCAASSNEALARAARSVAKLLYTKNGASYVCAGTLINDGGAHQVPYMYTAAHCIDSQATAATVNTFWFFEATACGRAEAGQWRQLAGGATLLHADPESDVALLRLVDRAPDGAWFAGWDATALEAGAHMVGLHHPMGDLKKLAIGDVVGRANAAFNTAAWRFGTTEPGSSGSGLFTLEGDDYLLRGALRGGSASCTSSGNLSDPSNRDYYSRLDRAMPKLWSWLSATAAPIADFGGLWYDADESGWGIALTQSPEGKVFVTWYTYDDAGRPLWFVAPEVRWTSAVAFEATLYRTQGSPWSGSYDASRFALQAAGTIRLTFTEQAATAELAVDGRTVVKPIKRLAL